MVANEKVKRGSIINQSDCNDLLRNKIISLSMHIKAK